MMKKVVFVLVLMLVATTCFAQLQSGPSNVVGYVKFVAIGGTGTVSTPFGLPFKFWDVPVGGIPTYGTESTNPSDILGDQPNCGSPTTADLIVRNDGGASAWRGLTSCAWTGTLESGATMRPGHDYTYRNKTGVNRNIVLAGQVDNSGNYETVVITNNAYVPYSWRDSRSVNRDDLNLCAAGFRGGTPLQTDQVIQISPGTGLGSFFQNSSASSGPCTGGVGGANWSGSLVTVEPGIAYQIRNRNHTNGAWNYNYDASGASLVVGGSDLNRSSKTPAVIGKMPTTPVKTKATSSTTRQ